MENLKISNKKNRNKNRRNKYMLGMALILMMALAACSPDSSSDESENREKDRASEIISQMSEINAWGEITYNTAQQIVVDFPSTVTSIEVKEGDKVFKDQVLAILDIEEFNRTIAKLEAQKLAGEAALSGISQDIQGQLAQIVQQKEDIETAQKDVDNAKILYEEGGLSKREYDEYVSGLNAQKTALKILEAQLEQTNKSNSSNQAQQNSSNNAIQKEIDIYRGRLKKTYLKGNQLVSPLDRGIVRNIQVENGAIVGSEMGQRIVMELIDEDSLYISAEVEEEFIGKITMETPVRIVPTMNPELEFSGSIAQIAELATEKDGSRIVKVRVVPEDDENILKIGYTVDVYFEI